MEPPAGFEPATSGSLGLHDFHAKTYKSAAFGGFISSTG